MIKGRETNSGTEFLARRRAKVNQVREPASRFIGYTGFGSGNYVSAPINLLAAKLRVALLVQSLIEFSEINWHSNASSSNSNSRNKIRIREASFGEDPLRLQKEVDISVVCLSPRIEYEAPTFKSNSRHEMAVNSHWPSSFILSLVNCSNEYICLSVCVPGPSLCKNDCAICYCCYEF